MRGKECDLRTRSRSPHILVKVLNFGSLSTDFVYDVPHILRPGETASATGRGVFAGGKGLNSTVALARAGADVYFAGTLGEDGAFLLDVLKDAGANVDFVERIEGPSGHTIIQVDPAAENSIIVFPGSNRKNAQIHMDDVLAHFEKGDYIVLQNEINDLPYLMEKAHDRGMIIVFNPSPCDDIIKTLPVDLVDYLIVNREEARTLAEIDDDASMDDILKKLHEKYPDAMLVVTLGSEGALYHDGKITIRQGIYPTTPVDTTGAGDTFLGNFVTGISEGMDASEALKLAAAASAISVSKKGAAASIPTRDETDKKLLG